MHDTTVSLAEAKARLSELTKLAAAGEDVVITKRGKPVVRLSRPDSTRQPVNLALMRDLTARIPVSPQNGENFVQLLRTESRY